MLDNGISDSKIIEPKTIEPKTTGFKVMELNRT